MSKSILEEALLEAEKVKEAVEETAKKSVLKAFQPAFKKTALDIMESISLNEADDEEEKSSKHKEEEGEEKSSKHKDEEGAKEKESQSKHKEEEGDEELFASKNDGEEDGGNEYHSKHKEEDGEKESHSKHKEEEGEEKSSKHKEEDGTSEITLDDLPTEEGADYNDEDQIIEIINEDEDDDEMDSSEEYMTDGDEHQTDDEELKYNTDETEEEMYYEGKGKKEEDDEKLEEKKGDDEDEIVEESISSYRKKLKRAIYESREKDRKIQQLREEFNDLYLLTYKYARYGSLVENYYANTNSETKRTLARQFDRCETIKDINNVYNNLKKRSSSINENKKKTKTNLSKFAGLRENIVNKQTPKPAESQQPQQNSNEQDNNIMLEWQRLAGLRPETLND